MKVLHGQQKDLGAGLLVQRMLPDSTQRSVGHFVFFDHFGPATESGESNHDIRPHPHIGLSTVTYMFEGAMMHRDSLGTEQLIEPGAVNLMTAGRGIVHSERKPNHLRHSQYVNHGLQLWLALPVDREEEEPSFSHTPSSAIPDLQVGDAKVRVIIGDAFGRISPVPARGKVLFLDVQLPPGSSFELPLGEIETGLYVVDGEVTVEETVLTPRRLAVLPRQSIRVDAVKASRFAIVGGDPVEQPRHLWWNFVSSRKERLIQAGEDWAAGRMGQVPGDSEFIPLPRNPYKEPEPMS